MIRDKNASKLSGLVHVYLELKWEIEMNLLEFAIQIFMQNLLNKELFIYLDDD